VYHDLLQSNETITKDRYRLELMRLSQALEKKRNTRKDTRKLFSSMTMLDNAHNRLGNAEIGSYPTRRTLLILPRLITTCSNR